MSLTLIAALTWPGRVIGRNNHMPWKLGADLRRFKALTLGHPVIMGRKTWESLPFALPGRTNLVVTRQPESVSTRDGAGLLCTSLDQALLRAAESRGGEHVYVIGGGELYAEALPRADHLALTLIHHPFEGDARFPAWDPAQWRETDHQDFHGVADTAFDFTFVDLERLPL